MKKEDSLILIIILGIISIEVSISLLNSNDHLNGCTPPKDIGKYRTLIKEDKQLSKLVPDGGRTSSINLDAMFLNFPSAIPIKFNWSNFIWVWIQFFNQDIIDSTPFIDGSQIYLKHLQYRLNDGSGKFQTQIIFNQEFPPFNRTNDIDNALLYALYTIWWREHNYWCDVVKNHHPLYSNDEIFHGVRHIITAEMQAIIYREILPILIGNNDLTIDDPDSCFQEIYQETTQIFNIDYLLFKKIYHRNFTLFEEYVYGASQIYQTLMTDNLELRNPFTGIHTFPQSILLNDIEYLIQHEEGLDQLLLGASHQVSGYRDQVVCATIYNLSRRTLTQTQNISYQSVRRFILENDDEACEEIVANPGICNNILTPYGLFLGLLIERGDKYLGPISKFIFEYQFFQIKQNDHYFYLWDKNIQ